MSYKLHDHVWGKNGHGEDVCEICGLRMHLPMPHDYVLNGFPEDKHRTPIRGAQPRTYDEDRITPMATPLMEAIYVKENARLRSALHEIGKIIVRALEGK